MNEQITISRVVAAGHRAESPARLPAGGRGGAVAGLSGGAGDDGRRARCVADGAKRRCWYRWAATVARVGGRQIPQRCGI